MAQSQSLCKWWQFTHVVLCLLGGEPQIDLSGLQAVLFVWFVLSNVLCFWQQCILPKSSSWQEDMDHCVWCHLSLSYLTTHHPQFPDLVLLGSIDHHVHSLVHVHRVPHTWTGESQTFSVSSNLLDHEWNDDDPFPHVNSIDVALLDSSRFLLKSSLYQALNYHIYIYMKSHSWAQTPNVAHSAPINLESFFTGTTNILFASGGHAITMYDWLTDWLTGCILDDFLLEAQVWMDVEVDVFAIGCRGCSKIWGG